MCQCLWHGYLCDSAQQAWCAEARRCCWGLSWFPLRAFGQGVPDKAFHVKVPRGIPFLFCKWKGMWYLGTWVWYPVKTSFVTLLFRTLRVFGKGILCRSSLGCSFSVSKTVRNVPGNTRYVPPETPFLKLLFRTLDLCLLFWFFFSELLLKFVGLCHDSIVLVTFCFLPMILLYQVPLSDLDDLIRANRFADSWIAWFARVIAGFPNWTPFFTNRVSGHYKTCESQPLRICTNCSNILKTGVLSANRFSRESRFRANRPDWRCESPGHLSSLTVSFLRKLRVCFLDYLPLDLLLGSKLPGESLQRAQTPQKLKKSSGTYFRVRGYLDSVLECESMTNERFSESLHLVMSGGFWLSRYALPVRDPFSWIASRLLTNIPCGSHVSNVILMRTRQKQKCATPVWNISKNEIHAC